MFLAELNGLKTWATDIGNACLEAETSEKVRVTAGTEFGELEGQPHSRHLQGVVWITHQWFEMV